MQAALRCLSRASLGRGPCYADKGQKLHKAGIAIEDGPSRMNAAIVVGQIDYAEAPARRSALPWGRPRLKALLFVEVVVAKGILPASFFVADAGPILDLARKYASKSAAGSGLAKKYPCNFSHLSSRRNAACSAVSTPSAINSSPNCAPSR